MDPSSRSSSTTPSTPMTIARLVSLAPLTPEFRLESAKSSAALLLEKLPGCIIFYIWEDHEFLLSGVSRYKLTPIPDEENEDKEEGDFENKLPVSYYYATVKCVEDLMAHYAHYMGHVKCEQFWKQCPVLKDTFTRNEIHFIEEMYVQRYVRVAIPGAYAPYYHFLNKYDKFIGFADMELRANYNHLFFQWVPPDTVPEYLRIIHAYLYLNNPLEQETFNKVITMFSRAKQYWGFDEDVLKYDRRK